MHSPRFTKLQAALATTTTQVTRCSRSFRLHPLQKAFQSRAYASGRNVPEVKTSDVPWYVECRRNSFRGLDMVMVIELSITHVSG